jgi:exosome complex exonuclease RRP6
MKDFPTTIEPKKYLGLDHTPFLYVENEDQLKEMCEHLLLETSKEIAVDLEHHSYRSYQGFTCLMQVSTRARDFIVDTIKLRGLIGKYMRGIFADSTKVKVLHGSDYDVEWL